MAGIRVGFGYDVHRFAADRALWLGGIRIESAMGLAGHSDADVLIHALCDAMLGAAGLRDIGYYFPDTAAEFEGIDSKVLLARTVALAKENHYVLGNADITVVAEAPKINPYIPAMRRTLAAVIGVDEADIAIKATTSERLGFTGRREGMAAYATVLMVRTEGEPFS